MTGNRGRDFIICHDRLRGCKAYGTANFLKIYAFIWSFITSGLSLNCSKSAEQIWSKLSRLKGLILRQFVTFRGEKIAVNIADKIALTAKASSHSTYLSVDSPLEWSGHVEAKLMLKPRWSPYIKFKIVLPYTSMDKCKVPSTSLVTADTRRWLSLKQKRCPEFALQSVFCACRKALQSRRFHEEHALVRLFYIQPAVNVLVISMQTYTSIDILSLKSMTTRQLNWNTSIGRRWLNVHLAIRRLIDTRTILTFLSTRPGLSRATKLWLHCHTGQRPPYETGPPIKVGVENGGPRKNTAMENYWPGK